MKGSSCEPAPSLFLVVVAQERLQAFGASLRIWAMTACQLMVIWLLNVRVLFLQQSILGLILDTGCQEMQFVNMSKMTGNHKVLKGFIDAEVS